MVKAIIFDLDNCLSAADEPGRELLQPMFAAIREANHGTLSEQQLERAFEDCWRHPLDWVATRHGFSPEMLAAGWAIAEWMEVTSPMLGYPDLAELTNLNARLFLVTSGFRRLQQSKIDELGIASRFEAVCIDAIDEPCRKGKQEIFREILRDHSLSPADVLVVGDNPDSEIAAGNNLGIPTVQILRPGVTRGANAAHYVRTLSELIELLA